MRFSFSAVALAASMALVNAQDLSGIPTCALTCFAAAVPASGCSLTDSKCQCTTGKDKIQDSIASCVPQRCSAEDQAKIVSAVEGICSRAGAPVSNLPTATATGSAGSSTPTGNSTSSLSGSRSATSSPSAQQTGNMAGVNSVGLGVMAVGMAAVFGL